MVLSLEQVSKSYERAGERVPALQRVSLAVDAGDFVGVYGPTGSGKTTLVRIAAGLERPNEGRVTFGGIELGSLSNSAYRHFRERYVGCIFNSRAVSPGMSVLDNVMLPLLERGCSRHQAAHEARELLTACAADHLMSAPAHQLSAGEQQRVAIAQALVVKPLLLLADELMSGLDLAEQDFLGSVLAQLAAHGVAILSVETDSLAVARAQEIHFIQQGVVVKPSSARDLGNLMDTARTHRSGDA